MYVASWGWRQSVAAEEELVATIKFTYFGLLSEWLAGDIQFLGANEICIVRRPLGNLDDENGNQLHVMSPLVMTYKQEPLQHPVQWHSGVTPMPSASSVLVYFAVFSPWQAGTWLVCDLFVCKPNQGRTSNRHAKWHRHCHEHR